MGALLRVMFRGLRLAADRAGVAGVEFALLAIPFFTVGFYDLQLTIMVIMRTNLEDILEDSARFVMVDRARGLSADAFKAKYICDRLTWVVDCNDVWVRAVAAGPDTGLTTMARLLKPDLSDKRWCTGGDGDYVLLQVGFETPEWMNFFRYDSAKNGIKDGQPTWVMHSSAQIRNEPSGGASPC